MTPADREAANAAMRDRMRAKWAAAAKQHEFTHRTVPPRVVIPLGPGAQVAIRNAVTFSFGPLQVVTRRLDQAAISAALLRLQTHTRTWPDGTMRGIKKLIYRAGQWVSPTMKTVWKDGQCSAKDFTEEGALRGHAGIHAVWPDKLKELNEYEGKLVEIAGWGQCTVADLGWRAQHARIVRELL